MLIIGTDTAALKSALANHAPQVPTYNMTAAVADSSDGIAVMNAAVAKAAELAHPGGYRADGSRVCVDGPVQELCGAR